MSNSINFSLIVPAAGDSEHNIGRIPRVFTPDETGVLLCMKSILGLNLETFDAIYFTVLRTHVEAYDVDTLLQLQFRRCGLRNARIIILDRPTSCQAETVAVTIERENIAGAIFIKDADSSFEAEVFPENGVAVFPLECLDVVDPRNKSYVAVDDMQHITNVIEKRVVSHLFNAGGYSFEDGRQFLDIYNRYRTLGSLYLSHIIYAMLLNRHIFRPIPVTAYRDWNLIQ